MPDPASPEPACHARGPWQTGRPSRWRAASDSWLREHEGIAEPGDTEPDVVEGFLREHAGLFDVIFPDRDDD